jgi:hypothetical protein
MVVMEEQEIRLLQHQVREMMEAHPPAAPDMLAQAAAEQQLQENLG